MERDGKEQDDDERGPQPIIDTEGGHTHLTEVIAQNTLKEIIIQAKLSVEEDEGAFIIPSELNDRLLITCEKVLLNYGETEAEQAMREEILKFLNRKKEFKDRDDERKVKERLPSDTKRQ